MVLVISVVSVIFCGFGVVCKTWNVEWNGMWNGMECGINKKCDNFVALKIRPNTVIVTMPAATSCLLERKHFETQQF